MEVRNFLFHRVSHDQDKLWPPMKPELFRRIIQEIISEFQVVNLEELLINPGAFGKSKKGLATILFDDGYKDNIEYAAPILKENGCSASFYVVTDCIDQGIPTWTYVLDHALQNSQRPKIELDFAYVPETFRMLSRDKGHAAIKKLKPWMKSLSNGRRMEVMNRVLEQCSDVQVSNGLMMTWRDIEQLRRGGFTIGSHTLSHPMLGQLESESEIKNELELSYLKIKQCLGVAPLTISYPIGSFDARVKKLAQQAGYQYGLAVEQKFFQTGKDDLLAIPRVELYQEPWWKVKARINGIYNRVKQLWR